MICHFEDGEAGREISTFEKAKTYPGFELWFGARADNLIHEGNQVVDVTVQREKETVEVRAKVMVGADGRFSVIHKCGGFELQDEDHHLDIVWFTIPKPKDYDNRFGFFLSPERNSLVLPKYPDSIQCGVVIPKNEFPRYVRRGIDSFRQVLLKGPAIYQGFAHNLKDFSPFNVLQAKLEAGGPAPSGKAKGLHQSSASRFQLEENVTIGSPFSDFETRAFPETSKRSFGHERTAPRKGQPPVIIVWHEEKIENHFEEFRAVYRPVFQGFDFGHDARPDGFEKAGVLRV